jgi:hypothetical protein
MRTDAQGVHTPTQLIDDAPGDGGKGLVFWILIALSVATLAPCVILPAWRDYQRAELAARVRAWQVEQATRHVERLEQRLDAIHNDPAVVARLARRALAFRAEGEIQLDVPVMLASSRAPAAEDFVPEPSSAQWQPARPPVAIARLVALLPAWDYDALFCESPTRETLLVMALVLFVAAIIIFWPRPVASPDDGI